MALFNKANVTGGGFQDNQGNRLAGGYLTLTLSHDSNVYLLGSFTGSQVVAGQVTKLYLNNLGDLFPNQFVWTNDQLTPAGSFYTVRAYNSSGLQVWQAPQTWMLTYAPTIDVGYLSPNVP